ncbi:gamma-glutamyltransferase family protein [Dermatobacter hominis]|uniref:gamma-glutamyltransferase family protein n=1 Tax=Dermatobacter hominis TaxID=2884263 RepID=UPI001D12B68B|nr:gamma-glutamyltransferase [Dermatobacter hominis]UDY37045.1 gamma-glutamyltransferase [Dermatobacter hominis]
MTDAAAPSFLPTTYSAGGLVASVDQLASSAGAQLLAAGGSAVDAAIAANAVLAVTAPHMCGLGGDLFALVHHSAGPPEVVDAAGRAGSGADPERLRREGHTRMPLRGDVAAAPVPGCVDGWALLHERHGRLPLADVLAPAIRLAGEGFPVSPLLSFMLHTLGPLEGCDELAWPRPDTGEVLVRPDLADTLMAIADGGREAFYQGAFGEALLAAGGGEYQPSDLAAAQARWVEPLRTSVWGHDVWAPPPTSSGYLVLAGARIAELCGLGPDTDLRPDEPAWAHLLVESARLAGHDRLAVLHDRADGSAVLDDDELARRAARFSPDSMARLGASAREGDTMYLCAVDRDGTGVSLIQSNAMDFGAHVAVPGTGVLLHNRGLGFSLEPGHPAEYGPGRRPPHTLSPAVVTRPDGSLRAVLGTMGGDSQPQVVLQMLARLLVNGQDAGEVVTAPRFVLAKAQPRSGFDTWVDPDDQVVRVESHAPAAWAAGLEAVGHEVELAGFDPAGFGHAQLIEVRADGVRAGAADPRSMVGAAVAST